MVCNLCVHQTICLFKEQTEIREESLKITNPNIEIGCRHREQATQEQLRRMREKEDENISS